jgi:Predicted NAD/FAD-binding protein
VNKISKKKIAVIGSGISGISSSYFLSTKYDVHLLKKIII